MPEGVLSVVIPAYNEGPTIHAILEQVLAQACVGEIIVVDDCSADNTVQVLEKWQAANPKIRLVKHERNQGKGAALRTGFAHAKLDYVIIQDADLEYDPGDYTALLQPLLQDKADVVYGSRYLRTSTRRVYRFWHTMVNRFLTTLSNMASDLYVTDMETCYKLFRREIIQNMELCENRFGFEPEITAKIAKLRCRVSEVAISYRPRSFDEGKKIGWKDGVSAIACIFKYNFIK